MNKEVVLTGIRANNDLHIGNYFGALLPIIDMTKNRSTEYQVNLFIPDLHSFTTPIDHGKLQDQIMHNLKIFVAAGLPLDNPDIHIYRQSYVPAHSEMTWILDCFAYVGELSRMTQFKDKILQPLKGEIGERTDELVRKMGFDEERLNQTQSNLAMSIATKTNVSAGLFTYPVLMAADILLYGAKYVPVGDDQTQHLEFTRDIAGRMNSQFGDLFVLPEPVAKQHEFFGKEQGLRIKDLADPSKKMSKSDDSDRGVIFMGDNPNEAAQKIMSATTDSEATVGTPDPKSRPGVSNLLQILELLDSAHEDVSGLNYSDFKAEVAEAVKQFLTDFQAKLAQVDEQQLMSKLESDEKTMAEVANSTLLKAQKAVGLRPA